MKTTETKACHVFVDGRANETLLKDSEKLNSIIESALLVNDIHPLHRHTHNFTEDNPEKQEGISMLYVLREGHCCIHTCPITANYYLDILIGDSYNITATVPAKQIAEELNGPFTLKSYQRQKTIITQD